MNTKPISPKAHALIDYTLAGSLLVLPTVFKLNKKVKTIYAVEGVMLLGYLALTETPVAVKPVIPFTTHGKIDSFNIAQFALQTGLKPFRKEKKATIFNIVFTALAGITVLLTDWHGRTRRKSF
jgi:hypothetical protein